MGQRGVGQRFAHRAKTVDDRYTANLDNMLAESEDASSPPALPIEVHH